MATLAWSHVTQSGAMDDGSRAFLEMLNAAQRPTSVRRSRKRSEALSRPVRGANEIGRLFSAHDLTTNTLLLDRMSDLAGTRELLEPGDFILDLNATIEQHKVLSHTSTTRLDREFVGALLQPVESRIRSFEHRLQHEYAQEEYMLPNDCTVGRAIDWVRSASRQYCTTYLEAPPAPVLSPGPEASVDVVWRYNETLVAANVPAVAEEPIAVYGKDTKNTRRRLRLEEDAATATFDILRWMTK